MPDIFDSSESRITDPLLVGNPQPDLSRKQENVPSLADSILNPGTGIMTAPRELPARELAEKSPLTLPEAPAPEPTAIEQPPPIESDTDAWDAATAYSTLPESPYKAALGDALASYQTRRVINDYIDPVQTEATKRRNETFANVDSLARDWKQEPQARERAIKAYGEDFVSQFEQSTEDGRAFLAGMKLLQELYHEPGDGEFYPLLRYMNETGATGLKGTADAWRHFKKRVAPRHAEDARQRSIVESLAEKTAPIIERMLAGDTLFTAMQSVPDLSPEERGFMLENCHSESDWQKSLQHLRGFMEENKLNMTLSEDAIRERVDALDKELNYTRQTAGIRGGFLTGELTSETVRNERYTPDELRARAIEELSDENNLTGGAIVPLARSLVKLRKDDKDAYDMLIGLYKLHSRRDRNDSVTFFSPFAQTMRNIFESAGDFHVRFQLGEFEEGDHYDTEFDGHQFIRVTRNKKGQRVIRPRSREHVEEINTLRAMQQEIANTPDGASWFRKLFDEAGKLSAYTTGFLLTRGHATFASSANDRYDELYASGVNQVEALFRGIAFGKVEQYIERIGGESLGRTLRAGARHIPFMRHVTGYFGGAKDQIKRSVFRSVPVRYGLYTAAAAGTEYLEELATPTAQYLVDNGMTWLFGGKDSMTWDDAVEQMKAASKWEVLAAMTMMGGVFGAVQLPSMAREAEIARMSPAEAQAFTGTTPERAQEIADIPIPSDKMEALFKERARNERLTEEQVANFKTAVEKMGQDLSGIKAMEAYQAKVKLGELPEIVEYEDGTTALVFKDSTAKKMPHKEAVLELFELMNNGMKEEMFIVQSNLVALATIESMKSTGKFITEKMTKTETMETIRQKATAARLRIAEGANLNDTIVGDPDLSPHLTLGRQRDMADAAEARVEIAKAQGVKVDGFRSNAYTIALDRSRHLIRYVEGKITFDNLMEETLESYIKEHLSDTGHTLDWYGGNLREAQKLLTEQGILRSKLIKTEGSIDMLDVVEALSKLARADVYARIDSLRLPQFIKDFLKWCRTLIGYVGEMAELGKAVRELADSGKLDKDIYQLVYDAAGITQEYWADAAMDSTHQTLADIAMAAVQGKQLQGNIAEAVAAAWSAAEQPGEPTAPDAPEEHPEGSTTTATISAGKPAGSSGASFSISPTLREDISNAWHHKTKSKTRIPLCSCPDVFRVLGLLKADIVTQASTISKLRNNHGLSIDEIEQAIGGFNDPVLVFRDSTAGDIILFPGMSALNKKGMQGDIMAAIKLERTPDKKHYMASLYPLDGLQKIEAMFNVGSLLYSRYTEQALGSGSNAPGLSSELLRLLVAKGFSTNTITEEAVVKWKNTQNALPENAVKFAEAMQQKLTERITATREAAHHDPDADPAVTGQQIADLSAQLATWQEFYRYPELMAQASAWDGNPDTRTTTEPAVAVDLSGGNSGFSASFEEGDIKLSPSGRYRAENDNVNLSEHLDEEVAPIEIEFTPLTKENRKSGKEFSEEALAYLQTLAGTQRAIGKTGYTLHIKASRNRAKKTTYNVNTQPRSEAFRKLEEVIARAYRLSSALPENREHESRDRTSKLLHTASIERFGYPAKINGQYCVIWFTALAKENGAKDVLLDEFGVTERKEMEIPSRFAASGTVVQEGTPNAVILGDVLENVKNEVRDMPKITKAPSFSLSDAREQGIMQDGKLEAANGYEWRDYVDDTASFSLVGEHAENWVEIKRLAFAGRDDGKLRVELDASQARIKPEVAARILRRMAGDRSERKVTFRLADILDYPALFAAYPKLAKMGVFLSDLGAHGTRAWYNRGSRNIRINTLNFTLENWDAEALRSTLLHEVQHAIQHIEGFANGNGYSNWDEYQRSAGEIEARAVQKRINMTAEERAANPVNDMLEFPGEALANINPPAIEVPFNLVTGAFEQEWGALRRSGNKAHMAFVQSLINALNKDAERLARYQTLAEDERGDMAVTLLRATNLAKTAAMYLPKRWRIGLKVYLDWMEVFSEVAHTGKMDWSASALAPFWRERMQQHLDKMEREFGITTGDIEQAMALLKDYGETRLYMLVNKLLKRVSNNLEEYGRKKMEDKIEELFQSVAPKTSKTRRTLRGVVSLDAFKEIAELNKLAHLDEEQYEEKRKTLIGDITEAAANEAPQEEREALDNKLLELEVYGCMGIKSLDELDRLYTCLVRHIRGEKEAWKALHEARQQRRRELAEGIIAGVKGRKGDYDASEEEAKLNSSLFRQGLAALETIESFPQLLYVLEKYPDTAALANNIRNRLALADGSYSENRVVYNDKFRNWVATAFGIDTKKMLANRAIDKVLNEFNKRKDTEIRLKEYEKKNLRLPLELALMRISGEDTAELRAELEAKLADLQARLAAEDMGNRPLTEQEQAAVARKEELTLTTEPMNDKEVDSYLREHASGDITNIATGIVGTIASNQRDKLVSRKAKDASVEGGFTYTQHNYAASRIAALFKHAIPMGVYEDKNGRIPAIHRFACPLILDGRVSLAFMTVKETEGKKPKGVRRQPGQPTPARTREHKIYSIQLDKIEELGSQLGRVEHLKHFHSPSSEEMIAQFNAAVNDYFLNVPESKVSLPPTLETDKAIKEVEKRLAALDMKLDAQDIDALRAWFELTPTARRAAEILRKPETERTPDELSVINKTFKKRHVDLTYNRLLRERSKSEHMSQNAALYLILSYEQEDNRARMESQGWTADVINRLRAFVGESGLKLGYLMREHLNTVQRERISRIFERENGIPFANIPNYFPLRFMRTDKEMQDFDMAAMLGGMSGGMGGGMTGFLAQRTDKHNLKIARGLGATAVWRDAVNTSEWWIQYQDILADLNAVLGHEGVNEALTVQFGKNTAVMLKQWVKDIEQMGHKENNARCGIQLLIDRLYEAGALSILSYRVETVIKQFTGLLNIFVGDNTLTFGDWVRGMCVTAAGKGRVSFLQMLKSPYIRSRINTGNDIAGERLARMGEDRAFSAGERATHFGMLPMAVVDAGVNAAPATVLYNAHYMRAKTELKADGSKRTDKEADAIARMHMLSAFDFSTQPLNFLQKSRLGVLLNSSIAGRAVAFMMSETFNKLGIWHALLRRRQGKKLIGFWLLYGAFNSAIGMLLDAMRDDPEEWEERDMMGYIWSALFGGFAGIPVVSESLEALLKLCGVDIYLGSSARGLIDGRSFVRSTARLYDMLMEGETDLEEWAKEFPRLMRTFGILGGATGSAFGGFLLFAAGMANPAKTANQALDSALLYALNPWDNDNADFWEETDNE